MSDRDESGQFVEGNRGHLSHGAYSYEHSGQLPARLPQDFDRALAAEILEHCGGDPAFRLLAESAARRATILEVAYSWLAQQDVKPFWLEHDSDGRAIVKWQPVLRFIGSYHEGLRRDLSELGLTPTSAAKLGLPSERGAIDYEAILARKGQTDAEGSETPAQGAAEGSDGANVGRSGENEAQDAQTPAQRPAGLGNGENEGQPGESGGNDA